ncbi:hypothetical protein HPB49_008240 [Dermacentor silvarum]|uniref:Uncharacterized protein n=1 Tax=Dermacentor silvarum TaxID=543639 RepID=A0ACB8C2N5_DERSI|nr:hypothetical protein HPB49_008240 [Dermacentor silvarum]
MRQEDSNQTDMGSTSTVFDGDQENESRKSEAIHDEEGTKPGASTQREFSDSEESQRPPQWKTGVTQEDKVHHPEEEVVSMTSKTSNKPEKTSVLARLTKADKATLKALIKISNLTGGDEEVAHQIEAILSEQARLKNLVMEQAQELAFQKGRIEELEKRKVELEQSSTEKQDTTNHGHREGASTQGKPKPTYAVIVTSSSLQKKEVAELIKKKVDPLHTGIEDAQMRPGREGIVMTTSSKEASDKLMRILEKDKDLRPLTVKQPKQNRLQVKVVGVEEELDIETLPERIIAQNRLNCSTEDIMVKKTWEGKNGKTKSTSSPDHYDYLRVPFETPRRSEKSDRPTYIKRKQSEVQRAVAENVRNKIRRAYNQCDASGNSAERKCSFCEQWTESFRQAYAASTTPQERYQLLTLLPSTRAKHEIKKLIPEASMYEINKSRKLKENHGVWYRPDPFTRHKVSPECVSAALAKWIVHIHTRKTQGKAIYEEKQCTQRGSIVFHFDFAENWTVVLPDEVQAYHWKKQQVSVFTCMVTTKKSTESFAIVSDDLNHDSAHACLALKKATEWVDDNLPVYSKVTYVSDGAASHFKNRYRLYEFGKSDCPNTQWIFSATGHGKNACDGVGGLVKYQAMFNNLRTSPESAIRAARDFVTILTEKLKGVHLIHLEEKEVAAIRDLKKDEWMKVPAFHGIQSWHAWQLSRSTEASPELYVARIAGSAWKKLCLQE